MNDLTGVDEVLKSVERVSGRDTRGSLYYSCLISASSLVFSPAPELSLVYATTLQ